MAANRFDQLIDDWEPTLRKAFFDAIKNVRSAAQIDQIARMLEAGDVPGALRAIGLDPAQFRPFDKAFEAAFEAGGDATSRAIPPMRDEAGFRLIFQFSIRNPDAETFLRTYSSTMIREIVEDQRNMARAFLTAGLERGANPRSTALDLVGRIGPSGAREGGMIGLTESQSKWVLNYMDELENNPAASLSRALRDRRFDRTVLRAVREGKPIPADLRVTMATAYRNRALRMRAETIARSETIRALHAAQDIALDQAVAGGVDPNAITVTWRSAHDKRVRDAHRELDGQSIPRGGVFDSILGPIRYPGDPQASAANVINCRCWLEPSIDFLAGIE